MKKTWIALSFFWIILAIPIQAQEIEKNEPSVRESTTYGSYGTMDEIITDQKEPTYDGFDSPNDMAFLFACIALLATVGLGIVNATD
ncbi:hypothetical protein BLD48_11985 [Exiguobacterium sp. KRL4]|uniref:hypothetical protein n=1 Tax=Exiguobacterium sp. KRL4 TaxID=1914536 RepID=UPI0008F8F113|nr:hypothetical protein [Exiguobacterium sp. KRL4]OIN66269.1 hypothetical protein BLD48_11985 [Exiguobacterium sp. KRL4]